MSKTAKFELVGQVVGHPEHGDLARGDVLTLEVGDDNLPKSELFRSRTRPLGRSVGPGESDEDRQAYIAETEKQAQKAVEQYRVEAEKLTAGAKSEADAILAKANAEAKRITDEATTEATLTVETAKSEAAEILAKAGKK